MPTQSKAIGQRMQIFIKLENPIKKGKNPFGEYIFDSATKRTIFRNDDKATKGLGRKKYAVLAYHHQWLYGRCAAFIAQDLMELATSFSSDPKENRSQYSHLLHPNMVSSSGVMPFKEFGNIFGNYMGIIKNPNFPRGLGFERFHFLNPDEPDMKDDFTRGDNNDGVLIVDTIKKKYCFMNIFNESYSDSTSVSFLPPMTPSSAIEYVNAYYPTEKSKLGEYEIVTRCENDPEKIKAVILEHKNVVEEIRNMFSKYEVLSLEEVKGIFPKVFKTKET